MIPTNDKGKSDPGHYNVKGLTKKGKDSYGEYHSKLYGSTPKKQKKYKLTGPAAALSKKLLQ